MIICNNILLFAPQGLLFPTRGKVDGKGSPRGRLRLPTGVPSARPDWVCRSGRETAIVSCIGYVCGNAGKSRSGDVETDGLCSRRRLSFKAGARVEFRGNSPFCRSRGQCFDILQEFIILRGRENGVLPGSGHTEEGERNSVPGTREYVVKIGESYPRESGNESFRASGTKNLSFPTRAGGIQLFFVKQSPRVYPRNCNRTQFQYPNAFLQNIIIPLYFVFPAPTFTPSRGGQRVLP